MCLIYLSNLTVGQRKVTQGCKERTTAMGEVTVIKQSITGSKQTGITPAPCQVEIVIPVSEVPSRDNAC